MEIVKGYLPGSIGRVAELHALYYNRHAGFGLYFESKVASEPIATDGFGNKLMTAALGFCREKMYRNVYLWTFEGLNAARHLYEKSGFRLTHQQQGTQWGLDVKEQRFELRLY